MDDQELLEIIRQSDKTDISVLISAKEAAKKRLLDDASQSNIAAFVKAKEALDKLKNGGDQKEPPEDPDSSFEKTNSVTEVLEYLQDAGWKIQKTQLYEHINKGKLSTDQDGFFTPRRVFTYAKTFLVKKETGLRIDEESAEITRRKNKMDLERSELNLKREQFRFEQENGKYVLRTDFEKELAARFVVLNASFKKMILSKAIYMIHLVKGNPERESDLIAMMNEDFNAMMTEYATTKKFHVIIMPDNQV